MIETAALFPREQARQFSAVFAALRLPFGVRRDEAPHNVPLTRPPRLFFFDFS